MEDWQVLLLALACIMAYLAIVSIRCNLTAEKLKVGWSLFFMFLPIAAELIMFLARAFGVTNDEFFDE